MKLSRLLAPGLLLATLAGCDPWMPQDPPQPYAPWESGLALVYEPQDGKEAERFNHRLMLRVDGSKATAEGQDVDFSVSSFQGVERGKLRLVRGGVQIVQGKDQPRPVLPEGFPDRVSRWETGVTTYHVVGRVRTELPGMPGLPESARTGIWVESQSPDGLRQRILYLQGIGMAEVRQWNGQTWQPLLRLVSRGFTDPEPAASAPSPTD